MKKFLMMSMAAVAAAGAFTSCSHDTDYYDPSAVNQLVYDAYNKAFIDNIGVPAPTQTWGFGGGAAARATRGATDVWNGTHAKPHNWESGLNFESEAELIAAGAVRIDTATNIKRDWKGDIEYDWQGKMSYNIPEGSVLYVSNKFDGELNLAGPLESSCSLYNYGNITNLTLGSANADITIYNAGTMVDNISPRAHEVYNTGTFIINNNDAYAKITNLYNSGNLVLGGGLDWQGNPVQANVKVNGIIYSTGTGIVELPGGADWMAECHIDGIVYTDAYLKIQNSTDKYMCGVVSRNANDNIDIVEKEGGLTTSYIKTNKLTLNGASVYLTNNGYVNANQIHVEGSANSQRGSEYEAIVVEPVTNAKAFVKTTSFDLPQTKIFGNHLGAGVYTKFETITYYAEGYENSVVTITAEEYFTRKPEEAGKLAPETLGGVSECGGAWGNTTTPKFEFLARIFAEDLSATTGSDFDFNDVVFDVYTNGTDAKIVLLAAGGTLPLTVADQEVHAMFGENTDVMINTDAVARTNAGTKGVDGKAPVTLPNLVSGVASLSDLDKIVVRVQKENPDGVLGWYKLTANEGQPASKFAVAKKIQWLKERADITDVYTGFEGWVTQDNNAAWYEQVKDGTADLYDEVEYEVGD